MILRVRMPPAQPGEPSPGARLPHPHGLRTLFFTEMWERFSYYGMRALLVLFMVDSARGGMGLTDQRATAIYGLYTAGVYLMALPGGWVADRLWGARRAVWIGGIVIAAGHFTLALPSTHAFFLGLILIVAGTGLLKPNISALVGDLYPEGGARRDAGFTIFYMGINLGAAIGPLICSALGEKVNWHLGFAAAGVGMVLGLIQFRASAHLLPADPHPERPPLSPQARTLLRIILGAVVCVILLAFAGLLPLHPEALAKGATAVIVAIAVLYFGGILLYGGLGAVEKKRIGVIIVLFISSAIFWAGFEQAGSSLNLFAERFTDRVLFGSSWMIPAGWFQSLGPVFIILFAPVAAAFWVRLGIIQLDPSLPVKFAFGLILLAAGFGVMALAAVLVGASGLVGPSWLVLTYLLHTFGELCVSPVGLSSVTKLAPTRLVGQMMGTWFLATSLGNLLAGLLAGEFSDSGGSSLTAGFLHMVWLPLLAAGVLFVLANSIKRWTSASR